MNLKILTAIGVICSLLGCSKSSKSIHVLCEKKTKGDYILKWEVFPEQHDDVFVEIYASDNDSVFPVQPVSKINVNKFIAIIGHADSLNYSFFRLKVGNTYSDVVTNRLHEFKEIQNFRDLGGYKTGDGKMIRWGKIYRSGEFYRLKDQEDIDKIDRLGLHSVIDFRSKEIQRSREDKIKLTNRYEVYTEGPSSDSIGYQVLNDKFLRGDAILYMQDVYEHILLKESDRYARFFDYLLDEKNYPLIFHCSVGKDQTGIGAFLLLTALEVPTDIGERDFMMSNMGIDKIKIIKGAINLTESQQEAFTMLTRTDVSYLRYGLGCVKKEYGSVDNYLEKALGLTKEKREKLKHILLY